jgi:hypothetical protein
MKIENWYLIYTDNNGFIAPELKSVSVCGDIFDSEKFSDGEFIRTSTIVKFNSDNFSVMTLSGSEYLLGKVDPQYEKIYPNAIERIKAWNKQE